MLSRLKPTVSNAPDYTRREAADVLNIGLAKLDSLVSSGRLQSYKLGNSRRAARRIRRESVERLRQGVPE